LNLCLIGITSTDHIKELSEKRRVAANKVWRYKGKRIFNKDDFRRKRYIAI